MSRYPAPPATFLQLTALGYTAQLVGSRSSAPGRGPSFGAGLHLGCQSLSLWDYFTHLVFLVTRATPELPTLNQQMNSNKLMFSQRGNSTNRVRPNNLLTQPLPLPNFCNQIYSINQLIPRLEPPVCLWSLTFDNAEVARMKRWLWFLHVTPLFSFPFNLRIRTPVSEITTNSECNHFCHLSIYSTFSLSSKPPFLTSVFPS